MNDFSVTADTVPALKLARSALLLFIQDAKDYLKNPKPPKDRAGQRLWLEKKEAFDDLCRCGRITNHLAGLNILDPEPISDNFRRFVRRFYAEFESEEEASL